MRKHWVAKGERLAQQDFALLFPPKKARVSIEMLLFFIMKSLWGSNLEKVNSVKKTVQ